MSANKHEWHITVLPEDDANRELVNGFHLELASPRQFEVLPATGGWHSVVGRFESMHVSRLRRRPKQLMVLLLDFDKDDERLTRVKQSIPADLLERVFVLGVWSEPERLKAALGNKTCEVIGRAMATDCRDRSCSTWGHDLLEHNAAELARLNDVARPVLFGD